MRLAVAQAVTQTAATPKPSLELMERMLRIHEVRLLNLADHVDSDAIGQLLDVNMQELWHLVDTQPQRHNWLRMALQLPALPALAFIPLAHRLVLLERPALLRVLAARALFGRRQALRRCIDRNVIEPLRLALGAATLQALLTLETLQTHDNQPMPDAHQALQKADISLPLLGWQGYACFMQDGMWQDDTIQTLIRIALPAVNGPHEPAHTTAVASGDTHNKTMMFMTFLPTLFPELTWLFG